MNNYLMIGVTNLIFIVEIAPSRSSKVWCWIRSCLGPGGRREEHLFYAGTLYRLCVTSWDDCGWRSLRSSAQVIITCSGQGLMEADYDANIMMGLWGRYAGWRWANCSNV